MSNHLETPFKSSSFNGYRGRCHGIIWKGIMFEATKLFNTSNNNAYIDFINVVIWYGMVLDK